MSYQVGQAVIFINAAKTNTLAFKGENPNGDIEFRMLDNVECWIEESAIERPATEAEILAEAVKHGWELDIFKHLRSKHGIWIAKTDYWFVNGGVDITAHKDLSAFGQECIAAHRLITALNLAK